jgi:hypothetical protein
VEAFPSANSVSLPALPDEPGCLTVYCRLSGGRREHSARVCSETPAPGRPVMQGVCCRIQLGILYSMLMQLLVSALHCTALLATTGRGAQNRQIIPTNSKDDIGSSYSWSGWSGELSASYVYNAQCTMHIVHRTCNYRLILGQAFGRKMVARRYSVELLFLVIQQS